MRSFRGISGIDSALFLLLAIDLAITQRRAHPTTAFAAAALILLFIVKLNYEHACHSAVFADSAASGFVPVPASHLAGATVGVFVALMHSGCGDVSRRVCFLRVRHSGDAFQT
jgi:phosphotransferase system  glucose/maltose/N-acetylglucosamine-specific IIC component